MGPMTPSVANFVEYFLSPAFQFCPWAEFLDGYWRMRDRENVLFMTYEEMKKGLDGNGASNRCFPKGRAVGR